MFFLETLRENLLLCSFRWLAGSSSIRTCEFEADRKIEEFRIDIQENEEFRNDFLTPTLTQ